MTELRTSDGRYACVICEIEDGTPVLRVSKGVPGGSGEYRDLCTIGADVLVKTLGYAGFLIDAPIEEDPGTDCYSPYLPF